MSGVSVGTMNDFIGQMGLESEVDELFELVCRSVVRCCNVDVDGFIPSHGVACVCKEKFEAFLGHVGVDVDVSSGHEHSLGLGSNTAGKETVWSHHGIK